MGVGAIPVTVLRVWGTSSCQRYGVFATTTLLKGLERSLNYSTRSMSAVAGSRSLKPKSLDYDCHCRLHGRGIQDFHVQLQLSRFYNAAAPAGKPKPSQSSSSSSSLQEARDSGGGAVTLSTAEKVKENVKTVSYGGVIIVGVVIGGAMLYYVLNELLSGESPNNIYSHAFKLCKLSTEVQDALGTPIKCYGEETRRGWRRHVAYQEFLDPTNSSNKTLRMRFYIEGPFKKGTVNLEKKTNEKGKYLYTYLMVDVDGYPPRTIQVPF